jgi:cysteinyl-tRNA synthetase
MNRLFGQYLEEIMGLKNPAEQSDNKLSGVMDLLIEIRKDARGRKDYATSDKIRNELTKLGILLKDEKDGSVSWGTD